MKIAKATPFEGKPIINMPSVYGGCTEKGILCRIPVIGKRPIQITATGLAEGLKLENGIIRGVVAKDCEFTVQIHAKNELGDATCTTLFKIHDDTMLLTPLLGFTSWNAFTHTVSQKKMEKTAEDILSKGIADYGYQYLNIDSGWQDKYGGKFDAVMPNDKFPDMKGFCDKMHSAGLKCGIYSTPMLKAWGCPEEVDYYPGCTRGEANILYTCVNDGIGMERMEENNVKQWEEWGFDYLKYDWAPTDPINADYMKKALLKANREIAFCVTVDADIRYRNYWKQNCCSWRANIDSMDKWPIVKQYMNTVDGIKYNTWKDAVSQGHFYDLDMLEIGAMYWNNGQSRLTDNEQLFAYTLRAFFLSPIQLSCVIDKLTDFEFDLIANEEIIKINQDSLADYPTLRSKDETGDVTVYERQLENGDIAIAIFNASDDEITQVLDLEGFANVRNLWIKTDMVPTKDFSCTVESHCAIVLRVSK